MIKIKPSELRRKTIKQLKEMKKELERALGHNKLWAKKRDKELSTREVRRNISRINTIIREESYRKT